MGASEKECGHGWEYVAVKSYYNCGYGMDMLVSCYQRHASYVSILAHVPVGYTHEG